MISYGVSIESGYDDRCSCQNAYKWDDINKICKIDCNLIVNTTTNVPSTIDQCICLNLYDSWDQSLKSCQLDCKKIS